MFDETTAVGGNNAFLDGCAKLLFLSEQMQVGILHYLRRIGAVVLPLCDSLASC